MASRKPHESEQTSLLPDTIFAQPSDSAAHRRLCQPTGGSESSAAAAELRSRIAGGEHTKLRQQEFTPIANLHMCTRDPLSGNVHCKSALSYEVIYQLDCTLNQTFTYSTCTSCFLYT